MKTPPLSPYDLDASGVALLSTYPPGIAVDLARCLAGHGITAEQIHCHESDVQVLCGSYSLAATLKAGGIWYASADLFRVNPEHPDAKRFPWGLDVAFARLDHIVNEKRAARAASTLQA